MEEENMLKRILALGMASILLLGAVAFPISARAEEDTVPTETAAQETIETTQPVLAAETTAPTEEPTEQTEETTPETTVETTEETTQETTEETEAKEEAFSDIDKIYAATAATLQGQTPGTGSIGGEWLALGLARAGKLTDSQKESYLEAANAYIEKNYNKDGQLNSNKPTENERLALALTAVGQDAANHEDRDLLKALEVTAWTTGQGNNSTAFALLAFNAAGYGASNVDALIQSLLNNQNSDGGWAITSGKSDSDTTAMVVQALAPFYGRDAVKTAVDNALTLLSGNVNSKGQIRPSGFTASAENTAQVIVALTALGIDPVEDTRFISKKGNTLLDGIAGFYVEGEGGFAHEGNSDYDQMATEQSFYALVSWHRLKGGKTSLYNMSDVVKDQDAAERADALIAAIGEVTADSGPAVAAARSAYEALTAYQKKLVENYDTLLAAEAAYAEKVKTAEDEAAAGAVEDLIAAIGTPVTLERETAISAARSAYDALTATRKALVKNHSILTAAETALKTLKDQEAAEAVEELISAIGTVTLDRETAITKARTAYNALTAAQKKLVTNLQTLVDAEADLAELKATGSVKFTLLGCWEHGDSGDVHTLADGNLSTWIKQKTYKIAEGATVREVFEKALTAAGMTWENPTGNYVESINGIGEFTNGKLSGWMYTLNGTHPNLGVNQQKVKNGDVIVFHYTDDYTREEGSEQYQTDSTSRTTLTLAAASSGNTEAEEIYKTTGEYLESLGTPSVGSIGGEWMVVGLARSGRTVPEGYYANAVSYISEKIDENSRLHKAKSTDNARLILALTAMGIDASNVEGFNLPAGLTDLEYVQKQGINGPIWALIAFDSGNYPIPKGTVTRENLIATILAAQLADGGWALSGTAADSDMTGMALQALAPYYKSNAQVAKAVDKALDTLSAMQREDGSYASVDGPSSESIAQVIVALTALGIDPDTDARFVKNDNSVLNALLAYYVEGGGFRHTLDGELDGMATEQAYYALTAYFRFLEEKTALYDMTDILNLGGTKPVEEAAAEPAETVPEAAEGSPEQDLKVMLTGICAGIGIGFVLGVLLCGGIMAAWIILKKQMQKK